MDRVISGRLEAGRPHCVAAVQLDLNHEGFVAGARRFHRLRNLGGLTDDGAVIAKSLGDPHIVNRGEFHSDVVFGAGLELFFLLDVAIGVVVHQNDDNVQLLAGDGPARPASCPESRHPAVR